MTTTAPLVATSTTGMVHRAFVLGVGVRRTASAQCASSFRYGARAVYLRGIHEMSDADRASGKLCAKCFAQVTA